MRRRKLRTAICFGGLLLLAYALLYAVVSLAESPTDRSLKLSDSRRLAYQVLRGGDPAKRPILLVHGAPADASSWRRFLAAIPADFDNPVIAVDRLGFGNSSPEPELSLTAHAEAIGELIATFDRKPVVVGHSYGGPVVLRLAASHADAIAGVVLVGGACDPYMEDAQWFRRLIDGLGKAVPAPWEHANAELLALTDENRAMESQLENVTCPVTVIHGQWDPVCPYEGTVGYLQRAIAHSPRLMVRSLPRTGHNIHLWRPQVILEELGPLLN